MARRVADQVGDAAAQRVLTHRDRQGLGAGERDIGAVAPRGRDGIGQELHQIGELRRLVALAAGEVEIGLDHAAASRHVRFEAAHVLAVAS